MAGCFLCGWPPLPVCRLLPRPCRHDVSHLIPLGWLASTISPPLLLNSKLWEPPRVQNASCGNLPCVQKRKLWEPPLRSKTQAAGTSPASQNASCGNLPCFSKRKLWEPPRIQNASCGNLPCVQKRKLREPPHASKTQAVGTSPAFKNASCGNPSMRPKRKLREPPLHLLLHRAMTSSPVMLRRSLHRCCGCPVPAPGPPARVSSLWAV